MLFLRLLRRSVLPVLAACCTWAFVINRVVIHWVDGPVKTATEAALLLGLPALALAACSGSRARVGHRAATAILLVFTAGEGRRATLRHRYEATAAMIPGDPLHPVTTTDLETPEYSFRVRALAGSHLRIVHISDLHVTETLPWEYFEHVHDRIRDLRPDLIVMTGDYVSRADRIPLLARWLSELPGAPLGTFGTLGNHDYWTGAADHIRDVMRGAGVRMIGGECVGVRAPTGTDIQVCGTEAPWGPDARISRATSGRVLTLALTHTPDNVYSLHEAGADVVFAGHTHGGQLRLPGLGALIIPSRYGRRFDEGHFVVDGTHLFVSAGVGADGPPLRLWCPPELLAIELAGNGVSPG